MAYPCRRPHACNVQKPFNLILKQKPVGSSVLYILNVKVLPNCFYSCPLFHNYFLDQNYSRNLFKK